MNDQRLSLKLRPWTLILLLAPALSSAEGTDWLIAPYGWLPSVKVDQSVDTGGGGPVINVDDLISKIDGVAMFRVEAARNRWGLTLDYIFLSLADQFTLDVPPPVSLNFDIGSDLDLSLLEFGGYFRPSGEIEGINYLLGVRQIKFEMGLSITPTGGATQSLYTDTTVTDVFAGARYFHRLGERWMLNVRGDLSYGDSEGTLNLLASIGYRVAGPFRLKLGYRHMTIEFEDDYEGTPTTTAISLSGPYIGFAFRF